MKMIATARGFDGKRIREAGDEFEMPEGTKASTWFEPVSSKPKNPKKPDVPDGEAGGEGGGE